MRNNICTIIFDNFCDKFLSYSDHVFTVNINLVSDEKIGRDRKTRIRSQHQN